MGIRDDLGLTLDGLAVASAFIDAHINIAILALENNKNLSVGQKALLTVGVEANKVFQVGLGLSLATAKGAM